MTEGIIIDLGTLETEDLIELKKQIDNLLEERCVANVQWETLQNNGNFVCLTRYMGNRKRVIFRLGPEKDILWTKYNENGQIGHGFITTLEDMKEVVDNTPRVEEYYNLLKMTAMNM